MTVEANMDDHTPPIVSEGPETAREPSTGVVATRMVIYNVLIFEFE